MKKHSKKQTPKAKRFSRLSLPRVVIVIAVLSIAVVTVVSRQRTTANDAGTTLEKSSRENFVTVKVAGQEVQVNSQTGQVRELTPDEARKLADGLKRMINKSSAGLAEVQQADGSVSMDLEGRFQNVTVARVNNDETVTQSCVDNPQAAGAFFRIDPKLIEQSDTKGANQRTPNAVAKQR